MKALSFLAVTLGASLALAYPAVKDKAEFTAKYTSAAGGSIDFVQKLEITAFDAAKDEFTLRNSQVMNGQEQAQEQQVAASDFASSQQVAELLAQCTAQGGISETVTVPKGPFNSCSLPQQNGGRVWIADVPFGFVKLISIDAEGNKMEAELSNFEVGQ